RFNNHFNAALALDFGDCIRFLICQQRRHARMGAHHQHGFTVRRPDTSDIAKQLVTDSDGIFGIAPSIAVMAGLGERPVEILPNALADISTRPRSETRRIRVRALSCVKASFNAWNTLSRFRSRSMSMKSMMMIPPMLRNLSW